MTLKEQLELRKRQWEEFNRWEEQQVFPERSPSDILADLGWLLSLAPKEVREHDPDPEKLGIQKMRAALAHLEPRE